MLKNLNSQIKQALEGGDLDPALAELRPSDRPDLADFQSNEALKRAKSLGWQPRELAQSIASMLDDCGIFSEVSVSGPGFINVRLSDGYLRQEVEAQTDTVAAEPLTIVMDYGGPNVAKPLHVGHLRSATIGEALKRIARALGHRVISDVHLGDWGTPLGMLIAELRSRYPYLSEFADGELPRRLATEIDAEQLNILYPIAAARFKEEAKFADEARAATFELQAGDPASRALWKAIVDQSVVDIRRDFDQLGITFDLWLGESDAEPVVGPLIENAKRTGVARFSSEALVIDVAQDGDKSEIPPLILSKSDGAATYATTDLGTIWQRVTEYQPDLIWYIVDQRQSLHFRQVFRAASKLGLIEESKLEHIGFGTMNGPDGKPFKTRTGGVMRLSALLEAAKQATLKEAGYTQDDINKDERLAEMIRSVAIGAVKFGDLAHVRTSDITFDVEAFVRFEGKTGPYLQYSLVRARSILDRLPPYRRPATEERSGALHDAERQLAMMLLRYSDALQDAFDRRLPSVLCDYAYDLSVAFNVFYHQCPVVTESDANMRSFRQFLTQRTASLLESALTCLGMPAPERMSRGAAAVSNNKTED